MRVWTPGAGASAKPRPRHPQKGSARRSSTLPGVQALLLSLQIRNQEIIWKSYGNHMDIIWTSYGHHMDIIWTSYESQDSKERPGASPRDWLAHSHELAKQSQAPTLGSKACVHFLSLQAMESELDCAQRMFSQGRSQNVIIANAQPVTNKVQYIRMKIAMLDRRTP